MASTFTNEQMAAIESRGRTIVSASAGSGKTTVMIEKIIRLIRDGCEVDEILAVTFTKKAASQMKEKLGKALIKAINDPALTAEKKAQLKRQLSAVASADISTIHSFCSKLLKSNFYMAGVDNNFRVIAGDDAEGTALKNEALDTLFEEGYENGEPQFLSLISTYWRKKSDNALRKIFLSVYESLRNRADYREYLHASARYNKDTFLSVCDQLLELLKEKCAYYLSLLEDEQAYFLQGENPPQIALAQELHDLLSAILSSKDYFEACALKKSKLTNKSTNKNDSAEKRMHIERLATLREKIVKIYDKDIANTLSKDEELKNFLRSGETAAALSKYLLRFDDLYTQLKAERGVLDYNDLEHKALALLSLDEMAAQLREKYRYVFVDEYQDVNPVQEAIVRSISGDNLFLVGDVKQSIYGFRGSKSKFFVEKQREFSSRGDTSLHMTRNFRSSDAVLGAVNSQFSLAMTPHTSQVDYARDSYMERGGRYALNDGRVCLHRIPKAEKKEQKARGVYSVKASSGKKEEEENLRADLIKQIIDDELNSKWYDADAGEYKRVTYSDIAVLSRKKQGKIAKVVAALAAKGVPVTAASAVNICEFAEVKTLIDILSFLDNAEQDVPLCSALLSAMGGVNVNELSAIRLRFPKEKYFRMACKRYAQEIEDAISKKLRAFYAYYQQLCDLSCVMDAGELMTKILVDTRMEAQLLSQDNGVSCLRRIHRLIEETMTETPLCVHDFLSKLKDLDYTIECMENGGEDSVKVLTMHSSKGLEYPIVIIDDLNASFNGPDTDEVLVEESVGLAPKAFDDRKMLKQDTLLRRLYYRRAQKQSIADELNLYYVALTRAKYGLHILYQEETLVPDICYAQSFADFTDFSVWENYKVVDQAFDVPKQERTALVFRPDEALAQEIMRAFTWKYAYEGLENLPVKSSATALIAEPVQAVHTAENAVALDLEETTAYTPSTGVESGLAYHAFLERFDFGQLFDAHGKPISCEALAAIVRETFEKADAGIQALTSEEKLVEILSNPIFYTLQGTRLYKEQQFLVSLPIKQTYALINDADNRLHTIDEGEEMLFQGAIDLLAVGDGSAWIIDYKYSVRNADAIAEHYQRQLQLYRLAVAKILKIPVDSIRCTIVNIYHGYQVDIP